jgi:uncharacterized protein YjbJ (UPF0337 family)
MLDENRIKGAAQDAVGTVEESLGVLSGDSETQATGKAREAAGEAQRAYGRASTSPIGSCPRTSPSSIVGINSL